MRAQEAEPTSRKNVKLAILPVLFRVCVCVCVQNRVYINGHMYIHTCVYIYIYMIFIYTSISCIYILTYVKYK